ncbi:hypothetical protein QJQ45_025693, partial [Haematococcus lacustris]
AASPEFKVQPAQFAPGPSPASPAPPPSAVFTDLHLMRLSAKLPGEHTLSEAACLVFYLSCVPSFSQLSFELRSRLARTLLPDSFRPGEVVFRQGDMSHAMYLVVSGTMASFAKPASEQKSKTASPGGAVATADTQPQTTPTRRQLSSRLGAASEVMGVTFASPQGGLSPATPSPTASARPTSSPTRSRASRVASMPASILQQRAAMASPATPPPMGSPVEGGAAALRAKHQQAQGLAVGRGKGGTAVTATHYVAASRMATFIHQGLPSLPPEGQQQGKPEAVQLYTAQQFSRMEWLYGGLKQFFGPGRTVGEAELLGHTGLEGLQEGAKTTRRRLASVLALEPCCVLKLSLNMYREVVLEARRQELQVKLRFLMSLEPCRGLKQQVLMEVEAALVWLTAPRGAVLQRQGQPLHGLYFIKEGCIALYQAPTRTSTATVLAQHQAASRRRHQDAAQALSADPTASLPLPPRLLHSSSSRSTSLQPGRGSSMMPATAQKAQGRTGAAGGGEGGEAGAAGA